LLVLTAAGAWFAPQVVLAPLGRYLVESTPPLQSDCLFVLAGDFRGQRITTAADLYRKGLAKQIFVSGPAGAFDQTEDELAIPFARRRGYTDVPFVGLPNRANSTVSEARELHPKLQAAGCKSVLVVTSDFHTRRAGRILRRIWTDLEVRMTAAQTEDFDAEKWWTSRTYQKTLFFEWSKTFADWLGL
jgi:uncharacterized SAM-binding protein YcdF (DUF218 family)